MKHYTSIADYKAENPLTPPEQRLVKACQNGEPCRLSDTRPEHPTPENTIRADLMRLLIVGGSKDCGLSDFGVFLRGAFITGALDLNFATARGMTTIDACTFAEQPRMMQAHLHHLSLQGSHLAGLFAPGLVVTGSVLLSRLTATKTVDISGAQITGQLACNGATLNGQTGPETWGDALNAQGVTVGESMFLSTLTATGMVDLNGAQITGQGDCEGAAFDGKGDDALNAQRMVIKEGFLWRGVKETKGQVYLANTAVGDLVDDIASWPDDLYLDGFTYDRISGAATDAKSRLAWLRKGATFQGTFFPQPYTQLAKVLSQMGHDRDARMIRMAAKKDAAAHNRSVARSQRRIARAFRRFSATRNGTHAALLNDLIPKLPKDRQVAATATLNRFALFHNPTTIPDDPNPLPKTTLQLAQQQFRNEMWAAAARSRLAIGWSWVADNFMRLVVGYGFAPWRAFGAMLFFVLPAACYYSFAYAAGAIVPASDVVLTSFGWFWSLMFAPDTPTLIWDQSGTARHYETFYGLAYALDVFIPIVDLGQQSAWSATTVSWLGWGARVGTMVLELVGWVVTALGAAAITGLIQRDRS